MVKRLNEKEPLQKHTLNLYHGDFACLQDMYPAVGAAVVIRKIVRDFIKRHELTPTVDTDELDDMEVEI